MSDYNFAYLDEQTKRMIRRAILKGGLAIPATRCPSPAARCRCPMVGGARGGRSGVCRDTDT